MNNRRSFIVGIKSTKLSSKEKFFLMKYKPWGVILFTRNIKNIKQTLNLTSSIKKIFNDKKYPILIDQEGGRINRLENIISFKNYTSESDSSSMLSDSSNQSDSSDERVQTESESGSQTPRSWGPPR